MPFLEPVFCGMTLWIPKVQALGPVAGGHLAGSVRRSDHLSGPLEFGSLCVWFRCSLSVSVNLSPQTITMTSGPGGPCPRAQAAEEGSCPALISSEP